MTTDERINEIEQSAKADAGMLGGRNVDWLIEQLRMARESLKIMKDWYSSDHDLVDRKHVYEEAQRGLGERK